MSDPGPSTISQATILDLKAITAEHVDKFSREGRSAVRGQGRTKVETVRSSRDVFERPSPGLLKRLATEARNDAKRRVFMDDEALSDEQRRQILQAKADRYDALSRGDLSVISAKDLEDAAIDFDRKVEEGSLSGGSDVDDQAPVAGRSDRLRESDDLELVEYQDELGRTRMGTRKEAREATSEKKRSPPPPRPEASSSYSEVQSSSVVYGDQNFFPVYEPDPEELRAKQLAAEEEARAHHYDSTKEVRRRGAGQYQFALDEVKRAEQMASLKAQREETERARRTNASSAVMDARKRKLDQRRAFVEAKRSRLLGGDEAVARLRAERKAAEADSLLEGLEAEMHAKT